MVSDSLFVMRGSLTLTISGWSTTRYHEIELVPEAIQDCNLQVFLSLQASRQVEA